MSSHVSEVPLESTSLRMGTVMVGISAHLLTSVEIVTEAESSSGHVVINQ